MSEEQPSPKEYKTTAAQRAAARKQRERPEVKEREYKQQMAQKKALWILGRRHKDELAVIVNEVRAEMGLTPYIPRDNRSRDEVQQAIAPCPHNMGLKKTPKGLRCKLCQRLI